MFYQFDGNIKSFPAKVEVDKETSETSVVVEIRYTIEPTPKQMADLVRLAMYRTRTPCIFVTQQEEMLIEGDEPNTLPDWILQQAAVHLRRRGYMVEKVEITEPKPDPDPLDAITSEDTREGAWELETGDLETVNAGFVPPVTDTPQEAITSTEDGQLTSEEIIQGVDPENPETAQVTIMAYSGDKAEFVQVRRKVKV